MTKICIIGCSGTGKTTLANNLGKELKLPVYYLDGINYFSNWEARDKKERDKIILEKIDGDKWIIDGTYSSTLPQRLEKSDFVIFLDYSTISNIIGIVSRFIKNRGKEKKEIPGCNERIDYEFFWWVVNWRRNKRKGIIKILNQIDSNKVYIFKNRRKLNKWYKKQFNKKIECC